MFDRFRSERSRVLRHINKKLDRLEKMSKEGLEDEALDEALERMNRLESLWAPDEPTKAPPQGMAPQFAPMWSQIPENYRGIVNNAVKWVSGMTLEEALSDPTGAKLKTVMDKAGPWINRLGGLDALKRFLPAQLSNAPPMLGGQSGTTSDPYYKPPE
jgi:hypothetical protein